MMNLLSAVILLSQLVTAATSSLRGQSRNRVLDTRVIGGKEAIDGRYSYAVSLQVNGRHFCGGSLIAPGIVLSAAHCQQADLDVKVVIGRHDLRNLTDGYEVNAMSQIPHPNYDPATTNNDYMMIILDRDQFEVSTEEDIDYIKLNQDYVNSGVAVTTMGYGETDPRDGISYPAPNLMHTEVFTLSNEECKASEGSVGGSEMYGWNIGGFDATYAEMITDNMICASDTEEGEDSCFGDSGGPLAILSDTGQDLQVGVVSWGYGCAHPEFPGVYARLSSQYDWIKEQVCVGSFAPPESFECDISNIFTTTTAQDTNIGANTSDSEEGSLSALYEEAQESEVEWTTIYEEDFSNPFGLFWQTDGSNNISPYLEALGREGIVHIHGGDGGHSIMRSNLITMENNPFTEVKVTFKFYALALESDDLCLDYELDHGSVKGEQCWSGIVFDNNMWYDDTSIEFDLSENVKNLRLRFQVKGDDSEDEILIDSVLIQGKTSSYKIV